MSNNRTDETDTGGAGGADGAGDDEAVTTEEVRHVAELARIDLDDSEANRFTEQFADILSYFETLDAVPDTDAEPDLVNVLRADAIEAGLDREAALENATETEDGYFKGPRVS
jgi:aspartyl-tRNA(Asn)/glutamyl-tRNA(Gln) amidotransferase subunit C